MNVACIHLMLGTSKCGSKLKGQGSANYYSPFRNKETKVKDSQQHA